MRWTVMILATTIAACSASTNDTGATDTAGGDAIGNAGAIGVYSSAGSQGTGGTQASSGGAGNGGTQAHAGNSGHGGAAGNGGGAGKGGAQATAETDGGSAGHLGSGGTQTSGSCGAIPARGSWDPASTSPVVAPDGEPGYEFNGKTMSVVVDPFVASTVWLGTGDFGLFKSTDCGGSWKHVSTGTNGSSIDKSSLWSMAVDPVHQGVIYVVGAYGAGSLWKSTNAGVDWVDLFPKGSGFTYNFVNNVSMDASDPLHLVVMSHGLCDAYPNGCLAETFDGGKTWPNYVSMPESWGERGGVQVINATTWIFGTGADGMFVTTDNGRNWKRATPQGAGDATGEFSQISLAPAGDGAYYVNSLQGALRSTDGVNWSLAWGQKNNQRAGISALLVTATTIYGSYDYNNDFYSAPLNDYATWSRMPGPMGKNIFPDFLSFDSINRVLYAGCWEGGLFRYALP